MGIVDVFSMAIRNMFKRKVRTILTVFGVVIGATAITIMISLGVAVNRAFEEQIAAMGHRALRVEIWAITWNPMPGDVVITDEVIAALNAHPNVRIATPQVSTSLTFMSGRYVADHMQIIGIKPEAMELLGFHVGEGRNLNNNDEFQIVFSPQALTHFRNPRNRSAQHWWQWQMMGIVANIDLLAAPMLASFDPAFGQGGSGGGGRNDRPYMIQGVGILASGGDMMMSHQNFMPLEQVLQIERERNEFNERQRNNQGGGMWMSMTADGRIIGGAMVEPEGYERVLLLADHHSNMDAVIEHIESLGFVTDIESDRFQVWHDTMWMRQQQESAESLQNLLAAIGAVSLFVAAIGIANTMIMSIYERTREIGVMKVIGASLKDIRRLFLLEAAMIGALGGILGLGLSALVSFLLNDAGLPFLQNITQGIAGPNEDSLVSIIPMWLYGLAFGFSSVIGLVSGFLPARRATKISALAAIRME